ncbi:MAG: DUF4231 domain-containing protein [Alphaproteobacteria bacterium]
MEENLPEAMSPDRYIKERVEQYQSWYDRKAVATKRLYLRMRACSVVGGGLVPVLINVQPGWIFVGLDVVKTAVTMISLLVVVFVSLESVFHYREQWKNYRSTEQLLGHEKFLFQSRVGRYAGMDDAKAFRVFVERVEDAIASENAATLNVMTTATEATGALQKSAKAE